MARAENSISLIVNRMGGRRIVANNLGVTIEAVDFWIRNDSFPPERVFELRTLAEPCGIELGDHLFKAKPKEKK